MSFSLEYLSKCLLSGIKYIYVTLELSVVTISIGLVLGLLIAILRVFKVPVVHKILGVFVSVYAGIPVMVSMLIYNLIYLLFCKPVPNGAFIVACFTLTLGHTVTYSESIRGAFLSVPKGQYEASYACGLSIPKALQRIIIPQVIPIALPSLTNNIIGSVKNTSIVLVLGIVDILNGSIIPCAETYSFVEGYVAAAIIYWILSATVEFLLHRFNHLFMKGERI